MEPTEKLIEEIVRLQAARNWTGMAQLLGSIEWNTHGGDSLHSLLMAACTAALEAGQLDLCCSLAVNFERTFVNDNAITLSDRYLHEKRQGHRIVATFDPDRQPGPAEIVICYGDFPHTYENLAFQNRVLRHYRYFWNVRHDHAEYDPLWDNLDAIFIINLDERRDRYFETLRELARIEAPFEKVIRLSALKSDMTEDSNLNGHIGCAQSHLAVVQQALNEGCENILVLEDDFCFTSELRRHKADLSKFFERRYDYDTCLLATSKFYVVEPFDDLLNRSRQECTTCAGYLLSRSGMAKLADIWTQALESLIQSRDSSKFACDRSWTTLQSEGKFFVFKKKLGFQRPSFSTITNKTQFYMD